ncbi:MAG: hypothetical protein M1826_006630 [Phylliscum demangeonii]|nr:MAG: hypothetical protein M1826_006630 [Phylliscum demangeonii]
MDEGLEDTLDALGPEFYAEGYHRESGDRALSDSAPSESTISPSQRRLQGTPRAARRRDLARTSRHRQLGWLGNHLVHTEASDMDGADSLDHEGEADERGEGGYDDDEMDENDSLRDFIADDEEVEPTGVLDSEDESLLPRGERASSPSSSVATPSRVEVNEEAPPRARPRRQAPGDWELDSDDLALIAANAERRTNGRKRARSESSSSADQRPLTRTTRLAARSRAPEERPLAPKRSSRSSIGVDDEEDETTDPSPKAASSKDTEKEDHQDTVRLPRSTSQRHGRHTRQGQSRHDAIDLDDDDPSDAPIRSSRRPKPPARGIVVG